MTAAEINVIRQEWRGRLFTDLQWEPLPHRPAKPGEAGGEFMLSDGHCAYLKPVRIVEQDWPHGAHEKIAYDLAHELGASVPPVLLYERPDVIAGSGTETLTSLSYVLYDAITEFDKIPTLANADADFGALVNIALPKCASSIALDLFVGNDDRNNRRNTLFGIDELGNGHFLFIDYSNSMNWRNSWNGDLWRKVRASNAPSEILSVMDKGILAETAEKIRNLKEGKIVEILDRIPEHYLSNHNKTITRTALLGRREIVADYITQTFLTP